MFIEELKNRFGYNVPIFTNEILELFSQYTRAYVFRMINAAEERDELLQLDTGVYYLPEMTPFGPSVITASEVAKKKYIQDDSEVYGIYSGLTLKNEFSLTTQITNIPEIISNRASSRCRKVTIDGMEFVLRKARVEITADNANAYRVLQLFTETKSAEIDDLEATTNEVLKYIYINEDGVPEYNREEAIENNVSDEVLEVADQTYAFMMSKYYEENNIQTRATAFPVYGNWCGPHYGSGTPIDLLDKGCKDHDQCYADKKRHLCSCDKAMLNYINNNYSKMSGTKQRSMAKTMVAWLKIKTSNQTANGGNFSCRVE